MPITDTNQQKWLNMLKNDLTFFNPDTINGIKDYLPQTGLNTRLITLLENLREEVMPGTNPRLNQTYNTILTEFSKYIEERITEMASPKECPWTDPWLMLSQVLSKNGSHSELLETSLHIHDLLFTARVVIEHQLKEGKETASQELKDLKKNLTEKYVKLLKEVVLRGEAEQILNELENSLSDQIDQLENSLTQEDFAKAKSLLEQADRQMRVSGEALKALNVLPK